MKNSDISAISENLSVLGDALQNLSGAAFPALPELMQLHESRRQSLDVLIRHYIDSRRPEHELEQRVWQTVHAYLQQLDLAYASNLQESAALLRREVFQQAVLQRLECFALYAKWHYLRYQALTEYFWRELHATYQMAEADPAIADEATMRYLQVLMLDSVNRSNMTRLKIDLVDGWLSHWCKDLSFTLDFDPNRQQFFVDLHVPQGARRIRKLIVGGDCRYWHVDSFIVRLESMRQQLANGDMPSVFKAKTTVPNALRLVEKLLAEWARNDVRRERRSEDRQPVMKYAQVVHGILNVCQHVKNMGFGVDLQPPAIAESNSDESSWLIENESKFGFGTFVYADFNRWLEPGFLIAMDYDLNPDLAVVGIVRSIEQRSAHRYSVGIEVLSHTPSYIRLQQLAEAVDKSGMQRLMPFAAIFLPENNERKQPASIVMPVLDYVPAAFYELRNPQLEHVVQLGEVIEQQADWIRVAVSIATDINI